MNLSALKKSGGIRLLPILIYLLLTFYLPVAILLSRGIMDQGGVTFRWLGELTGSDYYRRIFFFTFFQALLSTLLSLIAGLPGGWLLSHVSFPGKKLIKALTTIPFILPSILVVLGFILFWGRQGVINSLLRDIMNTDRTVLDLLYSFKAILLAHVFYNFPIALRLTASWWEGFSENQTDAAGTLGASRFRIFFTITLPQLLPGLMSAASLIFLYCFMSFAVILVLGGGPRYSTMEVEVYRLIKYSLDFGKGGALALVETAATLFITYFYIRSERRNLHTVSVIRKKRKWHTLKRAEKSASMVYLLFVFIIILGPILAVVTQSFLAQKTRTGQAVFSLKWYSQMLSPPGSVSGTALLAESIRNSLGIASAALVVSLLLGAYTAWVLARYKMKNPEFTESLIMMPMGVSSVVLGIGYLWLQRFGLFRGIPPVGSIILAHSVIALPFVLRSLTPSMRRISQNILDAASLMGAGGWKRFITVELPLVRPGLITGGAFAFAISLGEINATLILSEAGITTIPIAILRLIGTYKFFPACALGTILIGICLGAFILIDAFEGWEN